MPAEAVDVVLTNKDYDGKTLVEWPEDGFRARRLPDENHARCHLCQRAGAGTDQDLPRGHPQNRRHAREHGGSREESGIRRPASSAADMVFVGLGIVLGGMVGAIVVPVMGIPITLSTSGGALFAGIIIGWLRGVYPTFGRIPAPTLWFMNNVGLNVFIAVVGITAGPTFVAGIKEAGIGLFLWGFFATSVPMLLAPWIGKYIFKLDPAINLGCSAAPAPLCVHRDGGRGGQE